MKTLLHLIAASVFLALSAAAWAQDAVTAAGPLTEAPSPAASPAGAAAPSALDAVPLGPRDVVRVLDALEGLMRENGVTPSTSTLAWREFDLDTSSSALSTGTLPENTQVRVDRALDSAYGCLARLARVQAAGVRFHWIPLGKKTKYYEAHVANQHPRAALEPAKAIPGVSALRFTASAAPLFVESVAVVDDKGLSREYPLREEIATDLPKRTVLSLDLPASITQARVSARPPEAGASALLLVEAGVPTPPETYRAAKSLCERARALCGDSPGRSLACIMEARKILETMEKTKP